MTTGLIKRLLQQNPNVCHLKRTKKLYTKKAIHKKIIC